MSQYQLVPYVFRLHLRGNPQEVRPLDNIDGRGLAALDFFAKAATAHTGRPRRAELDATVSLQIDGVRRGRDTTMIEVATGVNGVRARILRAQDAGNALDIHETDWTQTPLRHVFFTAGAGRNAGLLLVERVGTAGALTRLHDLLAKSLVSIDRDLRLQIAPAMSRQAMEAWAADAEVKTLTLQHVHPITGEQARYLKGLPYGRVFEFRAPRKRAWTLTTFGGLDKATQLGILTELVPALPGVKPEDAERIAAEMLDDGWSVSLGLKKGKHARRVAVEGKIGITMTFPASVAGNDTSRPQDRDFQEACRAAIIELSDDELDFGQAERCSWSPEPWTDEEDRWEAVWGVPEPEPSQSPD